VRAVVDIVSRLSSSTLKLIETYQHQPIDTWIHLDVLGDVPVWHPRTYDAKRKQCLRNLDDGKYVWVGSGLAPVDPPTEDLA
jgi:hypothetical protein